MSKTLPELRVEIDALDEQLLALLNQRARVAEQVGEVKRREGTPFFSPYRVAAVIEHLQQVNNGPLLGNHVASVWREIMSACLALEAPQRVAVLGPAGTFCEQAAIEFFGSAANLIYCANFDEVFHATAAGTTQFGVVGMENSTEGVVARSLASAAQAGLVAARRAPSALLETARRSTLGRWADNQPWHCASACGWAITTSMPSREFSCRSRLWRTSRLTSPTTCTGECRNKSSERATTPSVEFSMPTTPNCVVPAAVAWNTSSKLAQ